MLGDLNSIKQQKRINVADAEIPENMPRMGNTLSRWCGRTLLSLMGWKLVGEIPNEKQLVIALAPHTSNWDFLTAMPLIMAVGVKVSYLMKKEAFFWPFKGAFMALGGIPTDRSKGRSIVDQIQTWFSTHEKCWVAITPEGTRSKVSRYKTGFLRIAHGVDVPVWFIAWDYSTKTFYSLNTFQATEHYERDVERIKAQIDAHFVAKRVKRQ
ncbi:1-acyl-sn-glycerol-3-phosphate acyltransferase [Marinibactrum halimedae]|uniref:Phospholipid/glycerol acyltransferase domain-containing protein n=1 Tax=Marinibactrum halimedae TaxID=1444977 RepID=A0AA37WNZ1_9GAMM|nr:1-acyl-sn-glycerol-3-phosphate acyltransferase [Marinibactrum halimedae]MCD9460234.1 1-acyl-sn-glycerol-3-phosphate acyltransferase [Marinibactrum halimedae]GLS27933.1 hypothetical protein GCM10007877_36520 [Marinibactrum halimedae]